MSFFSNLETKEYEKSQRYEIFEIVQLAHKQPLSGLHRSVTENNRLMENPFLKDDLQNHNL